MHPYLINTVTGCTTAFGCIRIVIPVYPLFALLGILAAGAVYLFLQRDRSRKIVAHILFFAVVLITGLVGSKVGQFFIDPALHFRGSGLTVTGGILVSTGVIFLYGIVDPHRVVSWHTIDSIAVAFPFGHALGRVGCYFAGCCYGKETHRHFFSCTYPENWIVNTASDVFVSPGPRIASPLLSALGLLLLGLVLLTVFRKMKKRGLVTALYFLLYAPLRFGLEMTRDDAGRGFFGPFSTGQWFSFFAFGLGLFFLLYFLKRDRTGLADPPFLPLNGKEPRERDAFEP